MKKLLLLVITYLSTTFRQDRFLSSAAGVVVSTGRRKQSNEHGNVSKLLDDLLRGYDNSVRPDFGGPPTIVEVDIMVRSMGPISEVDMTYSMDCYFRQSWVDSRLAFNGSKETLALSITMLGKIWKPDTYFYNGKQSYLHTITSPNKFVRLHQDGRVLYSSRLTIKAGCPMNLEDFPMDTQRCPLKFGSCKSGVVVGYASDDVIYKWNNARQVAIAEDMKLSQFDLVGNPTANQSTESSLSVSREYSMLLVSFHLRRHMGNFLIQVYGPCVLLVVLSWVSFWLNREATADRVSLGITTVLTMTFLGLEARTDLPKVPYPTALDFFVFLSFAFIFATIIQFAVVHYFTKYGSGECYFSADSCDDADSDVNGSGDVIVPNESEDRQRGETSRGGAREPGCLAEPSNQQIRGSNSINVRKHEGEEEIIEVIQLSAITVTSARFPCARTRRESPAGDQWQRRTPEYAQHDSSSTPRPASKRVTTLSTWNRTGRAPRYNSVSKIDRASRVVFPFLFLTINVFYWSAYLFRSERISYNNSPRSPSA